VTGSTKKEDKRTSRPPLTLSQVLIVVGIVAGLLIVLDFSQRLATAQRLRIAADQAATEVAQLERENAALQTQVAYATTDAAVIAWAHEHGKLVQPGEVLVVPVIPTPLPTPIPAPPPAPTPPPTWALWWNLFFDTALPSLPSL
jgi:cell division protein FtsB